MDLAPEYGKRRIMERSSLNNSTQIEEYKQFLDRTSLGSLTKRASNLLTLKLTNQLAPFQLTANHWIVLSCLWRSDGQPVTYIARQIQQIGGTLTGVLDRMEKRKLVVRRRDKQDRRIWRVFLTEKGSQLLNELPRLVRQIWDQALEQISKDEKERFSQLIDHCLKNLIPEYSCSLPECSNELPPELSRILPPKSLGYRMKVLTLALSRRFSEVLSPYEVTTVQWVALCRLWRQEGITTMEIGSHVDMVGGTLTGLLDRMEERGLVSRRVDEQDKRRILVFLTARGKELYQVLPPLALATTGEVTKGLKPSDIDFMKDFLQRMITALESK